MLNPHETPPDLYKAFLLRIWLEGEPDTTSQSSDWRFSVEDAHNGARRGFTSLEAVVDYLRALLFGLPDKE